MAAGRAGLFSVEDGGGKKVSRNHEGAPAFRDSHIHDNVYGQDRGGAWGGPRNNKDLSFLSQQEIAEGDDNHNHADARGKILLTPLSNNDLSPRGPYSPSVCLLEATACFIVETLGNKDSRFNLFSL